jgi:hypothetical protein
VTWIVSRDFDLAWFFGRSVLSLAALALFCALVLAAPAPAASQLRPLGHVATIDGGRVEVALRQAREVDVIQTGRDGVRAWTVTPGEAQALAEAMHDFSRIADGRANAARISAVYVWPELIERNRLPPKSELQLSAERQPDKGILYALELALPGSRRLASEFTPRDWHALAGLLSSASRR